jgi:FKBP-type peptidyl-prolyl cis-trans isomerase FkpA
MGYQMNRVLLVALLFAACVSGCKKTVDVQAQINAQLVKDDQVIGTYLKNNNITASVIDSASGAPTGIYYKIDTVGTGTGLFTSASQITVGWKAWYLKPDATLSAVIQQTDIFHPSYILGETLRGWQFGLQYSHMSVGGVITLYVPSHYAYGPFPQDSLRVPANSPMVFNIKLYNIKN